MGENLHILESDNSSLHRTPKAQPMKKIIDRLDFVKVNDNCSAKDNVKRTRREPQTEGKYLQKTYLKDYYPKYRKNS